jgi:cytochrome c oxidase cbb3-type subunit 3
MPAWRHLRSEQIAAIVVYMRSWQEKPALRLARSVPPGDYVSGEAHYRVACVQCHGEKGSGGVGPQLANPVLLDSASDALLFHWIGNGRAGTAMKGFLPAAQGPTALEPQQIADVIAYLRYVARGGDIPLRRLGEGDPFVGAQLFEGTCSPCHGHVGAGSWGPQLNNRNFLRSASDGFLASTIVLGREGTPMRSMVHGQQGLGQVAPEQVQDIIAYMRQWEVGDIPRTPASAVELSELAMRNGRELYAGYCTGCHGPNGRGLQDGPDYYAPALNNQDFLEAATDGFLLATIARGRRGTPMRPFGKGAGGIVSLSTGEISDIVSHIRSWQKGVPQSSRHAEAGGTNQ